MVEANLVASIHGLRGKPPLQRAQEGAPHVQEAINPILVLQ